MKLGIFEKIIISGPTKAPTSPTQWKEVYIKNPRDRSQKKRSYSLECYIPATYGGRRIVQLHQHSERKYIKYPRDRPPTSKEGRNRRSYSLECYIPAHTVDDESSEPLS